MGSIFQAKWDSSSYWGDLRTHCFYLFLTVLETSWNDSWSLRVAHSVASSRPWKVLLHLPWFSQSTATIIGCLRKNCRLNPSLLDLPGPSMPGIRGFQETARASRTNSPPSQCNRSHGSSPASRWAEFGNTVSGIFLERFIFPEMSIIYIYLFIYIFTYIYIYLSLSLYIYISLWILEVVLVINVIT